jgi:hypothetical protein
VKQTSTQEHPKLALGFGFSFFDLYDSDSIRKIDTVFLSYLDERDSALREKLEAARSAPNAVAKKDYSELILAVGPYLEDFIAELFGITTELRALQARHSALAPLFSVKRRFVFKKAASGMTPEKAEAIDGPRLAAQLEALIDGSLTEDCYAEAVAKWLEDEAAHAHHLEMAAQYAAWAALSPAGRAKHRREVLFKLPQKLDPVHLVHTETTQVAGVDAFPAASFTLASARRFRAYRSGCPLEEKISEMHVVKARGNPIGALAIVTIDNPMCAGTGHRICNDCMKSCIYQKQEPVDIPQAETRTLKDVLELPWGFEIYSLLTRWNPLNLRRPLPAASTGYKVLVVGLGPAGFTLAHHLMNDGHTVVGIDGLKIEPLPATFRASTPLGNACRSADPRHHEIYESLDERVMAGFGGVAEYGITVRWDKNFLKIIRLLLERRRSSPMFGGVRFGGTLTVDERLRDGLRPHRAVRRRRPPDRAPDEERLGARRAPGVRLPDGAAAHRRGEADSIANLQVRLPVVVIGGGLTAIDTATESLAYYVVQVEKFVAAGTQPNTVLGARRRR